MKIRALYSAILACFAGPVWSQVQSLAVAAPEPDNTGSVLVVAALAIGGGLVFLKIKRPETFAKLMKRGDALKDRIAEEVKHAKVEAAVAVGSIKPAVLQPTVVPGQAAALANQDSFEVRQARAIANLTAQIAALQQAPAPAQPGKAVGGSLTV